MCESSEAEAESNSDEGDGQHTREGGRAVARCLELSFVTYIWTGGAMFVRELARILGLTPQQIVKLARSAFAAKSAGGGGRGGPKNSQRALEIAEGVMGRVAWEHYSNSKYKEMKFCGTKEFRACWRPTETSARPSDARIATAASHFIGVFLDCAWCLQLSRTLEDPHWVRRRRDHDHATRCSSAPQEL